MNVHHQIPTPTGDDEDGTAGDSIDHHHHHIRYEDDNATGVVLEEDISHDSVYAPNTVPASELAIQRTDDVSSQLTLTFRGQVYVFDAVTPDKVVNL